MYFQKHQIREYMAKIRQTHKKYEIRLRIKGAINAKVIKYDILQPYSYNSKHTHNISVTIMLIAIYWRLKFDAYAFPWNQIFFLLDNILRAFSSHFLLLTCLHHVHKKYNVRLSNNVLMLQNIKVEYPFSYSIPIKTIC